MKCNPEHGYTSNYYGFYGLKQLKTGSKFSAVAQACGTNHNMGVFMRQGASTPLASAKKGLEVQARSADLNKVRFALYNSRATPPGNWRLMGMADFAEFKHDFVQSYNSNGIKALDTFTSNNCCIAVAGGEKLMISGTKSAAKNTHFQYPSQGGALKCNPARGYMGAFKFYAVNKISSDAKFSSGTGCSDGENPGIFIRVPKVMAELEFGMYNSEKSPAGGWKIMSIGQLEAHHDEFVTQYNYNSGIRLIASWKSKSCCFTLKGGANLNIKGYSGGVLFPATATQGIRCNPTLGYGSQGNKYYQFFGQRSLKESTQFVTNKKCDKGAAPGLYFRGTKTIETKAWTAHSDNKGRKCKTSKWSPFTACSKTCGAGTKSRRRYVTKRSTDCPALTETKACVTEECPVHCAVTAWSTFGPCTAKCGSGVQTKTRKIVKAPTKKGVKCPHLHEKQLCNTKPCSVHCQMGSWSKWTPCNAKCGGGKTTRQRAVTVNARFGGKACESTEQAKKCNTQKCAGGCKTSAFSGWSKCSKKCGGGMQYRQRSVNTASFAGNGKCKNNVESKVCNLAPCPVNCQLSPWSAFSTCTKKCGTGEKTRTRTTLVRPKFGGEKCMASEMTDTVNCNTDKCAIDCVLAKWSTWSKCSKTCGSGKQTRTRKINTAAKNGGKKCGAKTEKRACNADSCPVDCKLSPWSVYGACTVSCGRNGRKHRGRTVVTHPKYGGKSCKGQSLHNGASCDNGPCPVHCKTSTWSTFSSCSTTCGMGVKDRTREIVEHAKHGGFICPDLKQTRQCLGNDIFCPVDCTVGSWAGWSPCPRTCGNWQKITNRRTVKLYGKFNGKACPPLTKTKECNRTPCPRDCQVSEWGKWEACSKSCGSGIKTRSRTVEIAAAHGGRCPQLKDKPRRCNAFACPMDCDVTDFGMWSTCTKTCGGGKQTRGRSIKAHTNRFGGKSCPPLTQTRTCAKQSCPIDCVQGPWSKWTACTKTCGRGAKKSHWRKTLRAAANGGLACGATRRKTSCPYEACATDCKYSDWGLFKDCSASCGSGFTFATRTIVKEASKDGEKCDSKSMKISKSCNDQKCPINCGVSPWGAFGKCSTSCGEGVKARTRTILSKPEHGGNKCPALRITDRCFEGACPVGCKVGPWSNWSKCSKACGVGTTFATRKVVMKDAGSKCPKNRIVRECKLSNCPINCKPAGAWPNWSKCSKECGGGKKTRTRRAIIAKFGGKGCAAKELQQSANCNTAPCAVDCQVTAYGGWGMCSKACGGGSRKRFRTMSVKPANGGKKCPSFSQTDVCNSKACAVDCKVTYAKTWSVCSKTCGKGTQTRKYTWRKSSGGGKSGCGIDIKKNSVRNCNNGGCPIHCQTNDWDLWTLCSKTCGNGKKLRTRNVVVKAKFGGKACGSLKQSAACNKKACPVDCLTSDWSDFSKCTRACGKGENKRVRSIIKRASNGGKACGPIVQYTFCNTQRCAIDCTISEWGPFSKCSATSGVGTKSRSRSVAVTKRSGGKACNGPWMQTTECNAGPKAANCKVSSWGRFTKCSSKCGVGSSTRTRSVVSKGAKGKMGVQCPHLKEARQCQASACPFDCVLGKTWSPFTQCSKTCGGGMKRAVKRILKSAHSGGLCQHQTKNIPCNVGQCPVDCGQSGWSKFATCTKSCGNGGLKIRTRKTTTKAAFGGKTCGSSTEQVICNDKPCPIHCKITKWSKWSKCSKKCEGGKKTRRALKTTTPLFNGKECTKRIQSEKCNNYKCGIDCTVGAWKSVWSKCTTTCGSGAQRNYREVVRDHKHGGKTCPALYRTRACNTAACPVDCVLAKWSSWSKCSQNCGGGITLRTRKVSTYAAAGGKKCGQYTDLKRCNMEDCHWKESPAPPLQKGTARYTVSFDQAAATKGSIEVGFVGHKGVSSMMNIGSTGRKAGPRAVSVNIKQDIGFLFGLVIKAKGGATFTPKGFINIRTPSGQIIQFAAQTVTGAAGFKSRIPEEGTAARPMKYTIRIQTGKHINAGSTSGLFVRFIGDLGESRFYNLGSDFKLGAFTQKSFTVTEWIGKLKSITLENAAGDDIKLVGNTLVKTATSQLLKFPTNFWLGRSKDHKGHVFFEKEVKALKPEKSSVQQRLEHNDKNVRRAPKRFAVTKAPTPPSYNGKAKALKTEVTTYPTSAPTVGRGKCRNGKTHVVHTWHGAGDGNNYCNMCKCNNGRLSCTKRTCGKPAGMPSWTTKCKYTTCEWTRAVVGKTTAFAAKHVQVNHHHKEGRQNHRCAYNPFMKDCNCYCWTDKPSKPAAVDGIPLSEFKNWKCWRGYPGYAWKSRHHVHTIAMSGEVGSRTSGDQTKTIKNTDTHGHDHKKASALEDDTFDGCLEHAVHHHMAGLKTQGITFACHGGSESWAKVGYKRCEVHTTKVGDTMYSAYGRDSANMGAKGSSSRNYGMILKGKSSHVTCLRNEDVHDHWGSKYDSAYEMSLSAARKEYVGCRSNGRTDSGKTHKEHSASHYDSKGDHLRR
jgi:hypothetical protein